MDKKLKEYNKKRDFNKTREPEGKSRKKSSNLRFVVQLHYATNEHYDFRLEWNGILKSWVVPKGPSYNTSDKRLAVEVEDHPLAYRNFEGVIPKGQYGGGSVMIWDEGVWEPLKNASIGLKKGILKFTLKGDRLKGNWVLIRMKENNWLLVKEKDEFSNGAIDIKQFNTSIRTGRTMEEIESDGQ